MEMLRALRRCFPGMAEETIKQEFLAQCYGPLPGYSSLRAPCVQLVKTATVGAFIIGYAHAPNAGIAVVLIRRGDKGPNGEARFGVFGGYCDLGKESAGGEQPVEAAIRECREEAVDADGVPLLTPEPSRLALITSGIDYAHAALPVAYSGYAMELNPQEWVALDAHVQRLQTDVGYAQAIREKTGVEIETVLLLPLREVLTMPRHAFTHAHEWGALAILAQRFA